MFYNTGFSLQSLKSKDSHDNQSSIFSKGYIHKPTALQGTESIDGIHKIDIKELVSKRSKKKTPDQNLMIPPYTLKYDTSNSLLKVNPYSKFTNVQGFNQYAEGSALS